MHEVETDLSFWGTVITETIRKHRENGGKDYKADHLSSGFVVYNTDTKTGTGILKRYPKQIPLSDQTFLRWVTGLALLRAYNAVEILLLSAIVNECIKKKFSLKNYRAHEREVFAKTKQVYVNNGLDTNDIDRKNNRYFIQLLRLQSPDLQQYFDTPMNTDLTTTWGNFFEFISILRNVVAHSSMVIVPKTMQDIEVIAANVYSRYFFIDQYYDRRENIKFLSPIPELLPNVLNSINDFALNTVKFIKSEPDLKFTGLI